MSQLIIKNQTILIDDEDLDLVNQYSWCLSPKRDTFYVITTLYNPKRTVRLHRLLMGIEDPKLIVDHIDGNPLNNQKGNLRIVSNIENGGNAQARKGGSSKYKGVTFDKQYDKWRAGIVIDGKRRCLGRHQKEVDAALAYDAAARIYFGEYGTYNFPLDGERCAWTEVFA